jgi:hypothetical protein
MPCCGQGRAQLARSLTRAAEPAPRPAEPPAPRPGAAADARVLLRYLARAPIALRGARTGREYRFDATHAEQHVEAADAAALLSTRFFRRTD